MKQTGVEVDALGMGLFSSFRLLTQPTAPLASPSTAIATPWSPASMTQVVWSDIFGVEHVPVTRAEAMAVPAVAKARHLITSLARQPLRVYRGSEQIQAPPAWTYRTDTAVAPLQRMVGTLDDLLFYGWSLWLVARGADTQITDAIRIPWEAWEIDQDGLLLVQGRHVSHDEVVLIQGPFDGLLATAGHTIRAARDLDAVWADRVRNPVPITELHQTDDVELEGEEIQALLDGYKRARQATGGAVAYTPHNIDLKVHGQANADLFIEGRNAVTLDIARFTGIPASLLDASLSTASLTYSTSEGKRSEYLDMAVPLWLAPVEARLSMDDVVPRGQRVAFDLSDLIALPAPGTAPTTED